MPLRDEPPGWCPQEEAVRANVRVVAVAMSAGLLGVSTWTPKTIYIRSGLSPAKARCVIARELLRLRWGRPPDATPLAHARTEKALAREAARLLIPITALVESIRTEATARGQAAVLGVDQGTLRARLDGLTEKEWSAVTAIVHVVSA